MQQNSWLYSDSFLKRAFAIWGHVTVASLIIAIPIILAQVAAIIYFVNDIGNMMESSALQ